MATKTMRGARKRALAGAVRAMAMARKTAMASNNGDNHINGNDSNNNDTTMTMVSKMATMMTMLTTSTKMRTMKMAMQWGQ